MPQTGRRCRAPKDCSPDGRLRTLRSKFATSTVTQGGRTRLQEAPAAEFKAFLSVWLFELHDKERANERNR
jgi:hypothetical protein